MASPAKRTVEVDDLGAVGAAVSETGTASADSEKPKNHVVDYLVEVSVTCGADPEVVSGKKPITQEQVLLQASPMGRLVMRWWAHYVEGDPLPKKELVEGVDQNTQDAIISLYKICQAQLAPLLEMVKFDKWTHTQLWTTTLFHFLANLADMNKNLERLYVGYYDILFREGSTFMETVWPFLLSGMGKEKHDTDSCQCAWCHLGPSLMSLLCSGKISEPESDEYKDVEAKVIVAQEEDVTPHDMATWLKLIRFVNFYGQIAGYKYQQNAKLLESGQMEYYFPSLKILISQLVGGGHIIRQTAKTEFVCDHCHHTKPAGPTNFVHGFHFCLDCEVEQEYVEAKITAALAELGDLSDGDDDSFYS